MGRLTKAPEIKYLQDDNKTAMARNQRTYDNEYKAQAMKLAQEIGGHKAATELGIPDGTIYCWIKAFKEGRLNSILQHRAEKIEKNGGGEYRRICLV